MKNKMKDLDKLIEQILIEKFPSPYEWDRTKALPSENPKRTNIDNPRATRSYYPHPLGKLGRGKFGRVAKADPKGVEEKLEVRDLKYLIDHPEEVDPTLERYIEDLVYSDDEQVKELAIKVLKAKEELVYKKAKATQSIAGTSVASAGAAIGHFPPESVAIVNRFFAGRQATSLKGRLEELSKFSKKLFSGYTNTFDNLSTSQLLNDILMLDVLNVVAKDFAAGSAAYLFEYFLALIMGGQVVGAKSGPEGGMGAVDFEWEGGKGSAKFYQKNSNIKQSVKGFEKGQWVSYVIALKKGEARAAEHQITSKGTSESVRIMALDLYLVYARKTTEEEFELKNRSTSTVYLVSIFGDKIDLTPHVNSGSYLSSIYLASTETGSYRDMVRKRMDKVGGHLKEAYSLMEEMFRNFMDARENASLYVSTGDHGRGNEALANIEASEANLINLSELLVTTDTDQIHQKLAKPVEENNINQLDKLIERVILDKMED